MARGRGRGSRGGSRRSERGGMRRFSPEAPRGRGKLRNRRNFDRNRRDDIDDKTAHGERDQQRTEQFSDRRGRRGGRGGRGRGRRNLTTNDLDRDLENYWKGQDQEKQEYYKTKLDADLDTYFKGDGEQN